MYSEFQGKRKVWQELQDQLTSVETQPVNENSSDNSDHQSLADNAEEEDSNQIAANSEVVPTQTLLAKLIEAPGEDQGYAASPSQDVKHEVPLA
jgi:hypothetical protein